jgi:phenylacetate-coenzyme A ligase PaaK-like adenylate-forming protein
VGPPATPRCHAHLARGQGDHGGDHQGDRGGGLGAHYGAERLGCAVIPVSGSMTPRQVQLITDFRPRLIMVTPSYMLTVIDQFEKQGLDPRTCSLEIGIFGAEPWTEHMRQEMENRLDIHAVDIYGLSEVRSIGRKDSTATTSTDRPSRPRMTISDTG